jgi:hypothetical protein
MFLSLRSRGQSRKLIHKSPTGSANQRAALKFEIANVSLARVSLAEICIFAILFLKTEYLFNFQF